jgi:glycerophosphoryl diester phosphodiesterase
LRNAVIGFGILALALTSCTRAPSVVPGGGPGTVPAPRACRAAPFDLQGHRGARGLAPENTMTGFATALAIGVTTLELDVVLTREGVPVVTHDSRPNPDIARIGGVYVGGNGPPMRSLTLAEIRRYDVGRPRPGSRYARMFPDQTPDDGATIPTLRDVLALARDSPVRFNIETKVGVEDDVDATDPDAFVRAIVETARREGVLDRVTIQSFDWRTLDAAARIAPDVERSCLTVESWLGDSDPGGSPWFFQNRDVGAVMTTPQLAKAAGCSIWSPYSGNATAESVRQAQSEGLRVIPWTVNTGAEARRLLSAGVDGFITDYPDRMKVLIDRTCDRVDMQ